MNEQKYINSISVLKGNTLGRDISIGTYLENGSKTLLDINTLAYSDLVNIQNNLSKVLRGRTQAEYEWSTLRYGYESNKEFTIIEDNVFDSENERVRTSEIYELIVNQIKYLQRLSGDLILQKIKIGFNKIKLKRIDYQIDELRYKVNLENETIFFILLEDDFSLSDDEFTSTIKIKSPYLINKIV